MEKTQISSLKELQLQMPRIVEEYGNNNELTAIALANPLLALEKIGYTFSPEAKTEIENHVRFGKENASRYMMLKKNIEQSVGATIDITSGRATAVTPSLRMSARREALASPPGLPNRSCNRSALDNCPRASQTTSLLTGLRHARSINSAISAAVVWPSQ